MDGQMEELKKQLEGQRGARAYFEQQGWGESVKNMTPGVEALEWAIAEIERIPEAVRQAGHDGWEQGMADAKLQALGIRPLMRNPYLED